MRLAEGQTHGGNRPPCDPQADLPAFLEPFRLRCRRSHGRCRDIAGFAGNDGRAGPRGSNMPDSGKPEVPRGVPEPRTFSTVPDSRAYVHRACGGATVIGDWAFKAICDPLVTATGTKCVACPRAPPIQGVARAGNGET